MACKKGQFDVVRQMVSNQQSDSFDLVLKVEMHGY